MAFQHKPHYRYIPHTDTECVNTSADDDEGSVICGEGGDDYFETLAEACARPGAMAVSAISFSNEYDAGSSFHERLRAIYDIKEGTWHLSDENNDSEGDSDDDAYLPSPFNVLGIVYTSSITRHGAHGARIALVDMEQVKEGDVSTSCAAQLFRRLCAAGPENNEHHRDVWVRHLRVAIAHRDWAGAQRMHAMSARRFPTALAEALSDSSRATKKTVLRRVAVARAWKTARRTVKTSRVSAI